MSSRGTHFVTIVGVDFSPMSIQALDEALEVTNLRRGEVHVVYVEPELKVPEIEPPCPDCVARREATGGAALWCARHSEPHVRAHRYAYVQDRVYASEAAPYQSTPEA